MQDDDNEDEDEEEVEATASHNRKASPSSRSEHRLTIPQLPGSTDSAASFEFIDEGHTLGNALRYIIMKKYIAPVIIAGQVLC